MTNNNDELPPNHVTFMTHDNGRKLYPPVAWCDAPIVGWAFVDTHHAALSINKGNYASGSMCEACVAKIAATFTGWSRDAFH